MRTQPFKRVLDARMIMSVVATGLMSLVGICAETATNIVFPVLMNEFSVPTSTVQWLTTLYLLVLAVMIPASAWLKKRFMTKHLFAVAVSFFIIGTIICAMAPSFWILLAARVLQGMGTGIALPMMFNIIIEQVPHQHTGLVMGIASLTIGLGPAIGPFWGGLMQSLFGWRMIFLSLLPLLALAALLGLTTIRQSSELVKEGFDVAGYIALSICFICLIYALSNISTLGLTSPLFWFLIALALLFLWLFVRHSAKTSEPLLNLSIIKLPCFSACLAALLILQFIILARSFLIPNFMQLSNGTDAFTAGYLMMPACILCACLSPFAGRFYDKMGPKLPISFGFSVLYLALILEMLFMTRVSNMTIMLICLVYSFGQAFASNLTTFALKNLPPERYSDGTAIINTLQQLFAAMGTAVVSTLVAMGQASQPNNLALGTAIGVQWSLILHAIIGFVMVVLVLRALFIGKNK